jgi:transposase, IS5 family
VRYLARIVLNEDRLKELSAKGDALERLSAVIDFELFRAALERMVPRSDRTKSLPLA